MLDQEKSSLQQPPDRPFAARCHAGPAGSGCLRAAQCLHLLCASPQVLVHEPQTPRSLSPA